MINYKYNQDAEKVLNKLYSEHTATYYFTKELTNYMNSFVTGLSSEFNITKESSILEIGCNSGRLLSLFKDKTDCKVIGVEPSKKFKNGWLNDNLNVINGYFTRDIAVKLKNHDFDLIIFRHVFEHIKDPVGFFSDVAFLCSANTTVIIEVPYFISVLNNKRIDNIGYSHLNYFTIRSINEIVKKYNMGIKKYKLVETDGGSIFLQIAKGITTDKKMIDNVSLSDINRFLAYIDDAKGKIQKILKKYKIGEVVGYGAGAKGQHLIYILELYNYIKTVVDDTPGYENMYIPGTDIVINSPQFLNNKQIKAVINLAPTHSATINAKIKKGFRKLDFIELI